jgi:hypothetical protein
MQNPQLEAVSAGVQQLDGLLDGFAEAKDIEKLRKAGHGLAATAIQALKDADTAQQEAEEAFEHGRKVEREAFAEVLDEEELAEEDQT